MLSEQFGLFEIVIITNSLCPGQNFRIFSTKYMGKKKSRSEENDHTEKGNSLCLCVVWSVAVQTAFLNATEGIIRG